MDSVSNEPVEHGFSRWNLATGQQTNKMRVPVVKLKNRNPF